MHKKSTTYLLVVALVFIWGFIAFKIFSGYSENNTITASPPKHISFDIHHELDTFSISANYRDPFLGSLPKGYKRSLKKKRFQTPRKEPLIWPEITYNGALFPKNGKASFMININGKGYLFKKNQRKENVELLKGNKNYIIVRYKGKAKKFKKNY